LLLAPTAGGRADKHPRREIVNRTVDPVLDPLRDQVRDAADRDPAALGRASSTPSRSGR
jgi:hypothetical protein